MLRKVTSETVTVWIATRVPATVTLTVADDQNTLVMSGSRDTVAIGVNLHIVAVTARLLAGTSQLTEGIVYQYDLAFDLYNSSIGLAGATENAKLSYGGGLAKPSFALPPSDLNSLRVLQGSCRMPHAEGKDALPLVDDLIAETATNAYARPHQLMLTGDQIYADDVSDQVLLMLIDAADALLGWQEAIPGVIGGPMWATPTPACMRSSLLGSPGMGKLAVTPGFTSEDLQSHLMSLGEYLSMYLFTWSDVLWPPVLPSFDDVAGEVYKRVPKDEVWAWEPAIHLDADRIGKHNVRVAAFSQSLWQVRRALANIPSYMIFDDHEITDDWNMTREFCNDVYNNALGLRVVQNGLIAYALCQHWGNAPEQFETASQPGAKILAVLDPPHSSPAGTPPSFPTASAAGNYDHNSALLRGWLGIHDAAAVKARVDNGVFHDTDSLQYHFTVEGPSHQVIFTDTRTWRSFPRNADGTHLLTKNAQTDQFKSQILDAPNTGDRLLFAVITTNAPPVQPIRAATRHDRISNFADYYPDLYEAWELPSVAFDRLLVALTSKLPLDSSNQHAGAVILLSGDVHHSFATRILYRATKRYEDDLQPRGAAAVIAQLITSSLKKQTDSTVRFQREGYYAAPHPWITQRMIRHTLTEGYVGWNYPTGVKQDVGTDDDAPAQLIITVGKETVDVTPVDPLYGSHDSRKVNLTQAPHYRYRFDYLLPITQYLPVPVPSIPTPAAGTSLEQRKNAASAYDAASKAYRFYNLANQPKVIGVNNFGEIRLDWGAAANKRVNHLVRWVDAVTGSPNLTTYSVRLDINAPNDSEFPDIKARLEP